MNNKKPSAKTPNRPRATARRQTSAAHILFHRIRVNTGWSAIGVKMADFIEIPKEHGIPSKGWCEMISTKPLKPRKCKACPSMFTPARSFQTWCGPDCGSALALAKVVKAKQVKAAKERKIERADTVRRKEKAKTIPVLIAEAQNEFNKFIRLRDQRAGHSCISSGRLLDWSGNLVDSGHYRSTGAASHLRFNEDNCHAQSKHDNRFLSGNAVDYRIGLIARIGIERVEALEADNSVRKWTREELIAIKAKYAAMARQLKKAQQP